MEWYGGCCDNHGIAIYHTGACCFPQHTSAKALFAFFLAIINDVGCPCKHKSGVFLGHSIAHSLLMAGLCRSNHFLYTDIGFEGE